MTQRKEPSISNLFGLIDANVKVRKNPVDIVNGALELFDQAQQKLAEAEREIQQQVEEDQAEITRLTSKVADSAGQIGRLQRVADRLKSLAA